MDGSVRRSYKTRLEGGAFSHLWRLLLEPGAESGFPSAAFPRERGVRLFSVSVGK